MVGSVAPVSRSRPCLRSPVHKWGMEPGIVSEPLSGPGHYQEPGQVCGSLYQMIVAGEYRSRGHAWLLRGAEVAAAAAQYTCIPPPVTTCWGLLLDSDSWCCEELELDMDNIPHYCIEVLIWYFYLCTNHNALLQVLRMELSRVCICIVHLEGCNTRASV